MVGIRRLRGIGGGIGLSFSTRDNKTEQLLSAGPIPLTATVQRQSGQLNNTMFQISKKSMLFSNKVTFQNPPERG